MVTGLDPSMAKLQLKKATMSQVTAENVHAKLNSHVRTYIHKVCHRKWLVQPVDTIFDILLACVGDYHALNQKYKTL